MQQRRWRAIKKRGRIAFLLATYYLGHFQIRRINRRYISHKSYRLNVGFCVKALLPSHHAYVGCIRVYNFGSQVFFLGLLIARMLIETNKNIGILDRNRTLRGQSYEVCS